MYRDYDSRNSTVTLTLGAAKLVSGLQPISIDKGHYQKFNAVTVLEAWERIATDGERFNYKSDFERWKLDENYQPVSVTTYLGIK